MRSCLCTLSSCPKKIHKGYCNYWMFFPVYVPVELQAQMYEDLHIVLLNLFWRAMFQSRLPWRVPKIFQTTRSYSSNIWPSSWDLLCFVFLCFYPTIMHCPKIRASSRKFSPFSIENYQVEFSKPRRNQNMSFIMELFQYVWMACLVAAIQWLEQLKRSLLQHRHLFSLRFYLCKKVRQVFPDIRVWPLIQSFLIKNCDKFLIHQYLTAATLLLHMFHLLSYLIILPIFSSPRPSASINEF